MGVLIQELGIEECRALSRLSGDEDFQVFLEFLRKSLAKMDKESRRSSGDHTLRLQGSRLTLEWIIESSGSAGDILRRLYKQ